MTGVTHGTRPPHTPTPITHARFSCSFALLGFPFSLCKVEELLIYIPLPLHSSRSQREVKAVGLFLYTLIHTLLIIYDSNGFHIDEGVPVSLALPALRAHKVRPEALSSYGA